MWNLNQDTEVPTASVVVDGSPALNRVSWTPSGLHVTVGDDTGKIWVYDVAEVRKITLKIFFSILYIINIEIYEETAFHFSSNIAFSSSKD